ncbi:alanine--tRNA ligase [Methylomonas sp. EFPC3]|uniref:alanine--tRNA ligase n=1 Tax=Methylomonas sp. EFPC3 TaxID=3021710 RepID=UPI002417C0E3|nr:alanine--tRNA ligase [Methylomonas sp. EFPC3]WFP51990.1 alanine--tRNA ligase [Methylomonas sp. EFPC3]
MKHMTSAEIRAAFLEFFRQRGHAVRPSSSLVPGNDPTLLFTNAGMVQFKDVFLGREKVDFNRAATSQRCVRAGGKHNDLENVGYTARHHTFFEMLGNFSFGDYFKRDAINFAWDFLTKEMGIPPSKLWVTVFDEDSEAEAIWLEEVKIDPTRFSRIGAKDNFWSMGDVGPCGPCTEIFYDHGEHVAGGPPGSPDDDGDRYIEIWNLVFMQYERDKDGNLTPLPAPSVDTGMGLERIAAVMQGVHSNYEIDIFQNLVKTAAALAGTSDLSNSSLRVIADHIRSCAFLVADGVLPSNEGRGYVLRRIVRRAIRHGYRLGIQDTFFYKLVAPLAAEMGEAYPELVKAQEQVERVLKKEEERFAETLGQGMKILENCVAKLDGHVIPGDVVFLLYDTYGFPVDLTADFAREHNLSVDHAGFEVEMSAQRDRARAGGQFAADYDQDIRHDSVTEFTGYSHLHGSVQVIGLFKKGQPVESLEAGDEGVVILDQTPFYAESGGQVGDSGLIECTGGTFEVTDTQKQGGQLFLHKGKVVKGVIAEGMACEVSVNAEVRKATERNHSATHLLHAALRNVLGEHVQQKGSQVNNERLRFDFSHFEPMTAEQIAAVERLVNEQIRANNAVCAQIMAKDDAVKAGAMALFGEKYGDEVRVLTMGDFSTELCGGTHVQRTGDIGLLKIVTETGVAAGVRRVEAVTGEGALEWIAQREQALLSIAGLLKAAPDKTADKVQQLLEKTRHLEKELEKLKGKLASSAGDEMTSQAVEVNGVKVLAVQLDDVDPKALRDLADQLKNKLGSAALVLATVSGDKVSLIASVSKDAMDKVKAGDLVNFVATQVGGKGGGRPDMAQAGGNDPAALAAALAAVPEWVKAKLG